MEVDIKTIVKEVGMKKILESLIEVVDHEDMEGYEKQLRDDLEKALHNYEYRYASRVPIFKTRIV